MSVKGDFPHKGEDNALHFEVVSWQDDHGKQRIRIQPEDLQTRMDSMIVHVYDNENHDKYITVYGPTTEDSLVDVLEYLFDMDDEDYALQ